MWLCCTNTIIIWPEYLEESLRFAAELRQQSSVPLGEYEYVEKIYHIARYANYAEALVGKTGRGLNVEQRKKLSIGVELVAKPSLCVLDEPTLVWTLSLRSIVQFMRH
ncbi:ATV_HP_G0062950.mRNA.1.CDS.1 [Saccharomyces cerevisiae]|nr:ATV_HP_G0062950.mRNA.1.CDS.1 [Saccharomyces cerevisiae]CAI6998981.1 ATV_HP_G0062950.mRNA.1.CDS.1 [Saccharomyces cerevisiae]